MSYLMRLNNFRLCQALVSRTKNFENICRTISNSQKNRGTAPSIADVVKDHCKTETPITKEPWVSYGFEYEDKAEDRSAMKSSYFFSVTLCLVWGTFFWAYLPDTQQHDWAQREGFLELRRREAAGLEPISPDYISRDQMILPTDEELGNTEIII